MSAIISIVRVIANIFYSVIKLFPIQNKVTIVSRQSNKKNLDIELLEKSLLKSDKDLRVICLCKKIEPNIVKSIGYVFHLIKQLWHIGTSKAVVTDSYCIGISFVKQRNETKVVQMWHALGALKKFGKSIAGNGGEGSSEKIAEAMNMHGNYTDIIVSSENCQNAYSEAFGYSNEYIKVASLPRVDYILDEKNKSIVKEKIYKKYPNFKDKKIIVYAPTFRKNQDISEQIIELDNAIKKQDKDSEYLLVVKVHPLMNVKKLEDVCIDDKFTTLDMMFAAEYVICDYSAIVFEAALMSKPLFFYTFDYNTYEDVRNFYIDYKKEMPGAISENPKEIAKCIIEGRYDIDKVKRFADKYVTVKKDCAKKLADIILDK